MGKKLAIKGHSTRGKEVIELLEMMGGNNNHNLSGNDIHSYHMIKGIKNEIRDELYIFGNENIYYFTLEEFLEKYPFKVGDKVVYTKFGDNCDDYPVTIESMKWTGTTIEYMFNDCVTCLAKDLRMWNGEPDKAKAPKLKGEDYSGKRFGYKIPDGYEFDVVVDGKIFLKPIKPKYPTTYEECEKILGLEDSIIEGCLGYEYKLLNAFQKLLMCRDAYWKIAGEQMCLDRPWKADFTQGSGIKYIILFANGGVIWNRQECETVTGSRVLAFPTKEMRDAFYENFKDLIERCKVLL
jgi:hypothetical protein